MGVLKKGACSPRDANRSCDASVAQVEDAGEYVVVADGGEVVVAAADENELEIA